MIVHQTEPIAFEDPDRLADAIIAHVGNNIELALPLGLGKANHVANALFKRAAADPTINLRIFTALTLEKPRGKGDLERRFLEPIVDRVFAGYPELAYALALHARTLPPNVKVDEFFFAAGTRLGIAAAQQSYICANYTHALRYVLDRGVNVVAQLVAKRVREQRVGDVIGLAEAERHRQLDIFADAFDDRVGHPIRIFERDGPPSH